MDFDTEFKPKLLMTRFDMSRQGGKTRPRKLQESGSAAASRKLQQTLPNVYDLRELGKVPLVRNQGACGACWAFAALGALETKAALQGLGSNSTFDTSEQQLVDCVSNANGFWSLGCNGGYSGGSGDHGCMGEGMRAAGMRSTPAPTAAPCCHALPLAVHLPSTAPHPSLQLLLLALPSAFHRRGTDIHQQQVCHHPGILRLHCCDGHHMQSAHHRPLWLSQGCCPRLRLGDRRPHCHHDCTL